MRKILNVKYPTITTFTQHAHLIAILESEPRAKTWIYSNYIQIYMNKELNTNRWGDFYFPMPYEIRPFELCKWLEVQKASEEYVTKNFDSIVKYVTNMLEDNYYVHMMINYRYLSRSRFSRENEDRRHDILIYGYDDEIRTFYCADFMFETSKYAFSECTFDELNAAYNSYFVKEMTSYLNHNIYSYRLKKDCDYEYHYKNILFWIKQYLNCETPEYWNGYNYCNRENIVWGISCYDALSQSLLTLDDDVIDVRFYYLLKDHKKIMIERLKYLKCSFPKIEKYISEYETLYANISVIVNMVLKYNLTLERGIINKIVEKLDEIKNKEYKVLFVIAECFEDANNL